MSVAQQISNPPRISKSHIPFELDDGIAERAAIGVIVLGSDHTIEHEFRSYMDIDGVALYQSRIENSPIITPQSLADMEKRIGKCAEIILPGVELDVVAYGCTSASMLIGEDKVLGHIRRARPEAKCTTPITAAFAAFEALEAKNLAILTPYSQQINESVADYIENKGFNVTAFGSFNEEDDNRAAKISTKSIERAAAELGALDGVDLVFVSCTSLRIAAVVTQIEAITGKPVTSSNHAMAWHCLRLADVNDKLPQFGQLYKI